MPNKDEYSVFTMIRPLFRSQILRLLLRVLLMLLLVAA